MHNIVHLCDCMEFMKTCKDNQYELSICDPPYGIGFAKTHTGKGWIVREPKNWDEKIPDKEYFEELFRISKNQIIWGGNYFVKYLYHSQGWIFWDKGQRNFSLADGELAFTSFDRALRVFECSRSMSNFNDIKIHPTQKPVALYRWLLQNYAKQGDKIFDSHVGSGSSRIAAYELGFDFEGTELDLDYFNAQELRFKEFKKKYNNEFYIPEDEKSLFAEVE
jgi:site-specific DNA-methyltransferase (adenine-specific)